MSQRPRDGPNSLGRNSGIRRHFSLLKIKKVDSAISWFKLLNVDFHS